MMNMFFGPVKATFEAVCGDTEGAKETMDQFTRTNPIAMTGRIIAAGIAGDTNDMKKTVNAFGHNVENMANSTPIVGHAIAGGHALAGNQKKAEQVYLQATRTTVVAAAGLVGSLAGPVGAAALGAEAGTLWDFGEAYAGGQERGIPKLVGGAARKDQLRPGEVFDCVMTPVGDGMTGVAARKTCDKIMKAKAKNEARQKVKQANDAKLEPLEKKLAEQGVKNPDKVAGDMSRTADMLKKKVDANEKKLGGSKGKNGHVSCTMVDKDGNKSTGYSSRLTKAAGEKRFKYIHTGKSLLETTDPNIIKKLTRSLDVCAEHMAFENCRRPVLTWAVQIIDGIVKTVKRCDNCKQFVLGNVITDTIAGVPVPFALDEVPQPGSYISGISTGIIIVLAQASKNEEESSSSSDSDSSDSDSSDSDSCYMKFN